MGLLFIVCEVDLSVSVALSTSPGCQVDRQDPATGVVKIYPAAKPAGTVSVNLLDYLQPHRADTAESYI